MNNTEDLDFEERKTKICNNLVASFAANKISNFKRIMRIENISYEKWFSLQIPLDDFFKGRFDCKIYEDRDQSLTKTQLIVNSNNFDKKVVKIIEQSIDIHYVNPFLVRVMNVLREHTPPHIFNSTKDIPEFEQTSFEYSSDNLDIVFLNKNGNYSIEICFDSQPNSDDIFLHEFLDSLFTPLEYEQL